MIVWPVRQRRTPARQNWEDQIIFSIHSPTSSISSKMKTVDWTKIHIFAEMQTNITLELIPTQNYAIGFYILFIGESFWNMLSKIININDHEIISVLVSCFLNLLVILVLVFRRRNIFVFANSHNISNFQRKHLYSMRILNFYSSSLSFCWENFLN